MTDRIEFRELLTTLKNGVKMIPAIEVMTEDDEDDSQFMLLYTTFEKLEEKSENEVIPIEIVLAIEPYLKMKRNEFEDTTKPIVTNTFTQKPEYILKIDPEENPYVLMEALKAFWDDDTIEKVIFGQVLKLGELLNEELPYRNKKTVTAARTAKPEYYIHYYALWGLMDVFQSREELLQEVKRAKDRQKPVAMKIYTYFEKNNLFKPIPPEEPQKGWRGWPWNWRNKSKNP